jgi:hypothetical protein
MPVVGSYQIDEWDAAGEATLQARAGSIDDVLTTALSALLLIARGEGGAGAIGPEPDAAVAIPIRGQGTSYVDVFMELSGDLLAQLDANGTGLVRVRMDGVLETDTGYTAWGYALGEEGGEKPVIGLNLLGPADITEQGDEKQLTVSLGRSS